MKRIMIAALAVLMTLTLSVGGILPAFAAEHDHSAHVGALIGEDVNVGASDADELGPDLSGHKPTTFFPVTAEPINNLADFLAMQANGVYYLNTDLELPISHPGLKQALLYGNGHTVTTSVPMFLSIEDVEVHDLIIRGDVTGAGPIGALAKTAKLPKLYNVVNYANVTTTGGTVAGLIGDVYKMTGDVVFSYCVNYATIDGTNGYNDTAGLAGYVQGNDGNANSRLIVENCANYGVINGTKRCGGLFGCAGVATGDSNQFGVISIKNCGNYAPVNSVRQSGASEGGYYSGGLAARIGGLNITVENCINVADVTVSHSYGAGFVALSEEANGHVVFRNCLNTGAIAVSGEGGGMGAIFKGAETVILMENCTNTGKISGNRVAGILAVSDSSNKKVHFYNCLNDGEIYSNNNYAGGISCRIDRRADDAVVEGFDYEETIAYVNCVNNGKVSAWDDSAGGMAGLNSASAGTGSILVSNCINRGDVETRTVQGEGDGRYGCGGMLGNTGDIKITIEYCTNYGDVTSVGSAAGMLGSTSGETVVNNCDNHGNITNNNTANEAGGMIAWGGSKTTTVSNSVNTGTIYGGGSTGGILGGAHFYSVFTNCVNTGDVTGLARVGGIAGYVGGSGQPASNTATGCLNTGTVTGLGTQVGTDKGKTVGAIFGYVWGAGDVYYSASLGDVVATYPKEQAGTEAFSAGFACGYMNNGGGQYKYNYFTGSITVTNGETVFLKNTIGTALTDAEANYVGNFSVNTYPLYRHKLNGEMVFSATNTTPIISDTSSPAFINALNSAAGEGTFVLVTNCEGETFPIYKDTAAVFAATLGGHTDSSYYTKQNSDGANHWYECPVCGEIDTATVEAHKGGVADCLTRAQCEVCERFYGDVDADNHADPFTWVQNATTHSTTYTCCEETVSEHHDFVDGVCTVCEYTCLHDVDHEANAEATCQSAAYCGLCEMTYGDPDADNHTFADEWSFDDTVDKHYHACTNEGCMARADEEACSGGDAKCNALAKCEVCDNGYGDYEPEDHGSDAFAYVPNADDVTKHDVLHGCCLVLIETVDHGAENHVSDANCVSPAKCALCGEYGEKNPLNHVEEPSSYKADPDDAGRHLAVYGECCGAEVPEAHTGGTATCSKPATCDVCKLLYGEADGAHTFTHDCDVDCDVCGATRAAADHVFGDWTVTTPATETEPGTQERTCEVCGKTQTASVSVITNDESALDGIQHWGGAESIDWIGVLVVVGAVLLVGGVVAAFVISKKRKAK